MPKLKKKSIEQRSRADKERKQQIRGKSLHVGNLSEYNTNSQEREFSHETYGLSAVPTKIVAWLRGGERNKRIASRIVQMKFERERGMRGSHHILFTWPASWLVSKVLRQQSLLAMHESYGLSAVPTKIVAWFSQGGERNKRIASRILQMRRAETGDSFT